MALLSDSFEENSSDDKHTGGGYWYYSKKEIEEISPSRSDGIDPKKEAYLRKSYCTFLQDLGMRLKVPQITIATAIMFCHRFYLRQSHAKNDRRTIATACMFLAGKVEETPRPLKDVIHVSYEIINKKDPEAIQRIKQKEIYEQQKELLLFGERIVLATLGFDLNVNHPYKPLVEAIKKFGVAQNALAQVAWNFINDGLRTSLCLQFQPQHVSAGAIFLAAKFLKVKLPSDGERVWWQEFDVTPRQLEEVSNQMLELYEQNRVQAGDVQGSSGGTAAKPPSRAPKNNEHAVPARLGTSKESSKSHQSSSDNHAIRASNEHGSSGTKSAHYNKSHSESVNDQHPEQDMSHQKGEAESKLRFGEENQERMVPRSKYKHNVPNGEFTENTVSPFPRDAIKKIDTKKVKAALEKRKKARGDGTHKTELIDEDDLIERELEDGIEFAAERERRNYDRDRRPNSTPPERREKNFLPWETP